ncbi:hypothetical protein FH008_15555, partial [Listeria monocytogenes]|nr:hypothetical protein [Listeria monocytogenes]
MMFSRKEREQKQKNWRMWKKGKQWLCGAALFFTVISSPGMIVLADEVNSGNSTTAVTAGEVEMPIPEESNENEVEEITEEDETSSTEAVAPSQQEENTPSTAENNGIKTVEGKKERPKQGRLITTPTAINVVFPDTRLAEAIRVKLNKASVNDMVTQSNLDGITTFSMTTPQSTTLTINGIENLRNLTTLTLRSQKISNISPLSGLINLTSLDLSGNANSGYGLSDISPLSGLTNLTDLDLHTNVISDISPLAGLTNLRSLNLASNNNSNSNNNAMGSLNPLSNLTNLKDLDLMDNRISNLSTLASLPLNLETLNLTNIRISDVSPLSGLTNLKSLTLDKNQVSDVTPLSSLSTNLFSLSMSNNQISDISPLSNLTNLSGLSMSNNQISDISPLSNLTNLSGLSMNNNQISDVTPLSSLTKLISVGLSNNQISDISGLSSMGVNYASGVASLDLSNNQISDVSPLSGMFVVTGGKVNLNNNQISNIGPLATLKFTYNGQVSVDYNQISDISPLKTTVSTYNQAKFSVNNQGIKESIKWSPLPIEITNSIKGEDGQLLTPSSISNGGQYEDSVIKWTELLNRDQDVTYSWQYNYFNGAITFGGSVITRVIPASVKILVDSDGNSQTAGDQTLFVEKTSNLDSVEDMYNYAKDQLNGTDYGLLNVSSDDNGDYVILVSKVGSLKVEDANGTAVGTDVPYTPTYTVTGTGNAAQLEVSYGVTVDSAPGYVYIYEKNTPQEIRYVPDGAINIPLTDTDSNGIPQWREDYTVV